MENKTNKKNREGRFEFTLYVNGNIICKRNFNIDNYIERSMYSTEFRAEVDHAVKIIQNDLRGKTNVYTWYYYVPDWDECPVTQPLAPEWETTFKFTVSDGRRIVATRIFDGSVYPKAIRDRVDISNKNLRVVDRDGNVYTYDKDEYFEANKDRLSTDKYIMKQVLAGRENLIDIIIKTFQDTCSVQKERNENRLDEVFNNEAHTSIRDYTMSDDFNEGQKYTHNIQSYNNRLAKNWSETVKEKNAQYAHELFFLNNKK